ncbi:AI-2E family transporter [Candidatus Woesearchaeota archaeon]|jgi:predicted PurR-regulated permease PerM|nr:AI-2E family transporter [Candidatus Woesearchaeota archaeon]
MAKEGIEHYSKYFFLASFIGIILLSIYLIKSYIITIVGAVLLSYIFYPIYKNIKTKLRSKKLSSLLTTLLVVIIIIIPIFFAANALISESVQFFHNTKDLDLSSIEQKTAEYLGGDVKISGFISENLNKLSLGIARSTSEVVVGLPKKALGLFVMLFLMYFLFMEGKSIVEKLRQHIPLKAKQKEELVKRFSNVIYASIYGMIVTAFVQGAVGALGFWIFGVNSPILWGLVTVIVAILPFVGAALVWLPAAIFKLAIGETFNGLGLLFYGMFIISTIDNLIRPSIIGSRAKIHPAVVLLGVLGGIEIFGFLGIIIGPLILSIMTIFLDLYLVEKTNTRKKAI